MQKQEFQIKASNHEREREREREREKEREGRETERGDREIDKAVKRTVNAHRLQDDTEVATWPAVELLDDRTHLRVQILTVDVSSLTHEREILVEQTPKKTRKDPTSRRFIMF